MVHPKPQEKQIKLDSGFRFCQDVDLFPPPQYSIIHSPLDWKKSPRNKSRVLQVQIHFDMKK